MKWFYPFIVLGLIGCCKEDVRINGGINTPIVLKEGNKHQVKSKLANARYMQIDCQFPDATPSSELRSDDVVFWTNRYNVGDSCVITFK